MVKLYILYIKQTSWMKISELMKSIFLRNDRECFFGKKEKKEKTKCICTIM